jgi:hypothetical protein
MRFLSGFVRDGWKARRYSPAKMIIQDTPG